MSRSIDWYILIPRQAALHCAQAADLGREVKAAGFGFANPHLGRIMLIGDHESGDIPVSNESDLFHYLSAHATALLTLWKDDYEVALEFDTMGIELAEQASALGIDDDSVYGAVAIYVDHAYLRDQAKAARIIADVQRLFVALCGCLHAPFGFALDEWCIEGLATEWHVQREVAAHTMPSIQFPISYYSRAQFPEIHTARYPDLELTSESIDSSGYLFAHPGELFNWTLPLASFGD